jgi:CRP-like cAMP-binding protein
MDGTNIEVFSPGKAIFFEGEEASGMYILQAGVVELRKQTEKGEVVLRTVSTPNEFFGEMALIDSKPRSTSAIAIRETSLFIVDKTRFEQLLRTNGAFAVKIVKALSERIRSTNQTLTDVLDTSPSERIIRSVVDYALRYGEKGGGDARYLVKAAAAGWINSHIGASHGEIENTISRLSAAGRVSETVDGSGTFCLIVTGELIREYDRRSAAGARKAAAADDGGAVPPRFSSGASKPRG